MNKITTVLCHAITPAYLLGACFAFIEWQISTPLIIGGIGVEGEVGKNPQI